MNYRTVKFSNNINADIAGILKRRVKEYFDPECSGLPSTLYETVGRDKYGNSLMVWKTIFMISLYVVPYILMISGLVSNSLIIFGLWIVMGFGMAGIGLSVMHDANHRAYSRKAKVNKYLGYLMNAIGGSAVNWKIQHNVLHHSFTNIHDVDEDLGLGKLLRFSPNQKRYKVHRAQHFYAWFFYCLLTLSRVTWKDFHQLFRYKKMGLIKTQNKTFKGLFAGLLASKLIYGFYFIVIPMMFLVNPWWETLLFFFSMHFVASLILGCVFQCAHVMPTSEYPLPDGKGNLENNWTLHQFLTTTNFSPSNKIFSWFIGGLNYQIEHHLFPNICHVHYRNLSKIVKETTVEFGVPYNVHPNFIQALWNHARMLRYLGKYDNLLEK